MRPPLESDINKSDNGHLLFIGGADGMEGAIMMSVKAALEIGAGYTSLFTTERARAVIAGFIPELITIDHNSGSIADLFAARSYDAVVLGPGMGRNKRASQIFREALETLASPAYSHCKALIDGDGLFHLAAALASGDCPALSASRFVLTPHFLEAARLTGMTLEAIKANRPAAALFCAQKTGCTVLLKGPASIVSCEGNNFINTNGNSLLAAAGSGDALSGIIGAFLLTEAPVFLAACAGCYIHGAAADCLASEGKRHIKATDLISALQRI
jgi:NAD(P)H-hydrate epimerase